MDWWILNRNRINCSKNEKENCYYLRIRGLIKKLFEWEV